MDHRELAGIVLLLVMVGMVTGVGVLVLDKFGDAVKTDSPILFENTTPVANLITLANDELVSLEACYDENRTLATTAECNISGAEAGELAVSTTFSEGRNLLVNYTYEADSYTTDRMDSAVAAVDDVSNDWLTLVVTMVILSIIIGMVIFSFNQYKRR